MDEHEESRHVSQRTGWILMVAVCLAVLAWGYVNYLVVKDAPRQWDFGVQPDVPGQSIYSTSEGPTTQPIPLQVEQLPEATTQQGGRP